MTDPVTEVTPEFQRGWDAAVLAARHWQGAQAKKTLIQARRSRFPRNLEREAEVHQRSAEMIATLCPDDV
jgi:predicted Ser/Thr protein kinase